MTYKIYYRNQDANYPAFDTPEEAIDFYVKEVSAETGETKEEIMDEEWSSPTGVKKCVEVREVNDDGIDELRRKAEAYEKIRKNNSKAGKASWAKMTPEARSNRARKAAMGRWNPTLKSQTSVGSDRQ